MYYYAKEIFFVLFACSIGHIDPILFVTPACVYVVLLPRPLPFVQTEKTSFFMCPDRTCFDSQKGPFSLVFFFFFVRAWKYMLTMSVPPPLRDMNAFSYDSHQCTSHFRHRNGQIERVCTKNIKLYSHMHAFIHSINCLDF